VDVFQTKKEEGAILEMVILYKNKRNSMFKTKKAAFLAIGGVVVVVLVVVCAFVLWTSVDGVVIEDENVGVVMGDDGEVIGGAYVVVGDDIIKTDLEGLWDVSLVGQESVTVLAEGYERYESAQVVKEITLRKKSKQSMLTFVYDEHGPLEDAYLFSLDPNSYELVGVHKTDSNGLAWYPEMQQGWTMIWVAKEGYELGWMYIQVAEEDNAFVLKLTQNTNVLSVNQESWKIPFVKTAHAQAGAQINLQGSGSGGAVDAAELQAQLSTLFAMVAQLQADLAELDSAPVAQTITPADISDGPSAIDSLVSAMNADLIGREGPESGSFYGPVTTSSVSQWGTSNGIISKDDFFGTLTRSNYATLAPVPPPPLSDSTDDVVTVVVGHEVNVSEAGDVDAEAFAPFEFDFTAGTENDVRIESLEFNHGGTREISSDMHEALLDLVTDNFGVEPEAQEDLVDDSDPWAFEPEWTPEDEVTVEVVVEEVVVEEVVEEEIIEEVVEVEEEVVVEDEEEFVYICCYDPNYPDEPYFIPFLGDRCEDFPGAYQVHIPESECANDWLIDW
jgi:hypothetical protein